MPDGILVIDKPKGLTSHDVVAAARRALGEQRIGHTGTLDPMATGVLPLACGSGTRLVRFLTASDKEYDAEIRLGLETDTYDVTGREVSRSERRPTDDEIAAALATFSGEYLQAPPAYSAKKIGGRRAYAMARADVAVALAPVPVRVDRLELVRVAGDVVTVKVTCSAGFYVRSLAHDLGERLGTGGCLEALRRTRSGQFGLDAAVALDQVVGRSPELRLVPLEEVLLRFPAVTLTEEGLRWVSHGRLLGPGQMRTTPRQGVEWVRLLSPEGSLVALGQPAHSAGSLHPSVVLI